MKLSQLLSKNLIQIGLHHSDKKGIVEELVDILVAARKVADREAVIVATMEREAKGSTGLERGVAVPHCKTAAVTELTCSLAISREGIDFDAADGKPSHIFIFLAAPPGMSGPHVKALANIARLSQNEEFLRRLREAAQPEEALEVINEEEMLPE
ncbi:MAG: PTS sugar transporter subunit IIA [Candidatus Aureabacteria bacterium]|nr:PTS sugar transporter subunit IIA [Candidatus Auribacterota bacterium]